MKECKKITIIWMTMALVLTAVLPVIGWADTKKKAPLRAKIVFPPDEDKVYNLDNPKETISINLLLKNVSGSDVWTQEGFDDQDFHSYLFLYGPLEKNAKLITSASSRIGGSPTPSVAPEKVAVEELNSKMPPELKTSPWAKKIIIPELRDYFNLTLPGTYKLWLAMSFVQYDPSNLEAVDEDNDDKIDRYYVPFNDRSWSGIIEFKEEYITLKTSAAVLKSDIRVALTEQIFGELSRAALIKKTPVYDDFVLRLYSRSACETIYGEINSKALRAIANDAQLKSKALVARLVDRDKGEYLFRDVKQDDCVIIGTAGRAMDYKNLWALIRADDIRWGKGEISIELKLISEK